MLVGGVEQHGVAGLAAAQHVDVVVERAHDDHVDLGVGVRPDERVHRPSVPGAADASAGCRAERPGHTAAPTGGRGRGCSVRLQRDPSVRAAADRERILEIGPGGPSRDPQVSAASGGDDLEAQGEGHGDLAGVEGEVGDGPGRRSAAARWRASTVRSGCSRVSSAARSRQRWSRGTTWMRSQSSRRARRTRSPSVGTSHTRSTMPSASAWASADAHQTGSAAMASSTTARCGPERYRPSRAEVSRARVTRRAPRAGRGRGGRRSRCRPGAGVGGPVAAAGRLEQARARRGRRW